MVLKHAAVRAKSSSGGASFALASSASASSAKASSASSATASGGMKGGKDTVQDKPKKLVALKLPTGQPEDVIDGYIVALNKTIMQQASGMIKRKKHQKADATGKEVETDEDEEEGEEELAEGGDPIPDGQVKFKLRKPHFDIALRDGGKGVGMKPLPKRKLYVKTPVVTMLTSMSKIGPYGNYNIEDLPEDEVHGAPSDVSGTKYEVIIGTPREEKSMAELRLAQGYSVLRLFLEAWDEANARALTDPGVNVPYIRGKDHDFLGELNDAKDDPEYNWKTAVANYLKVAYQPRKKDEKLFPQSSIRRHVHIDDTTREKSVREMMRFSRYAFHPLYDKELSDAEAAPIEVCTENWPPRFIGREFAKESKNKADKPKTPHTHKYEELKIVDITGRTPEAFNARIIKKDRKDLRAILEHLRKPLPVSLGLEVRSYVSAPRTFHTRLTITDITLAVTWEWLLRIIEPSVADPISCNMSDVAAIDNCLAYLNEEDEGGEEMEGPPCKKAKDAEDPCPTGDAGPGEGGSGESGDSGGDAGSPVLEDADPGASPQPMEYGSGDEGAETDVTGEAGSGEEEAEEVEEEAEEEEVAEGPPAKKSRGATRTVVTASAPRVAAAGKRKN